MHWILQDNIFNEKFVNQMVDTFKKFDISYEMVKAVPFSGEMIPHPTIPPHTNVVAIGSYSFTNKAKELWSPGSWTNENFDYRVWSMHWNDDCLNYPARVYPFGDVKYNAERFFIRPCADDKLFTGQVMEWEEFKLWQGKVLNLGETYTELNADTPVVVGKPYTITDEYRFVIVDGRIVSGSSYGKGIQKEVDGSNLMLELFVQKIIAKWTPARVFVLDIATCGGRHWVLEMGNFNSAGLYACDPQKVIMAIEEMEY